MTCMYCNRPGTPIDGKDESFSACEMHAKILSTPDLAERFLKGHLIKECKGKMGQAALDQKLSQFTEVIREMAKFRKPGH